LEQQLDVADTMENRKRPADEYMRNGSYEEEEAEQEYQALEAGSHQEKIKKQLDELFGVCYISSVLVR
jgi:hypothetical protein